MNSRVLKYGLTTSIHESRSMDTDSNSMRIDLMEDPPQLKSPFGQRAMGSKVLEYIFKGECVMLQVESVFYLGNAISDILETIKICEDAHVRIYISNLSLYSKTSDLQSNPVWHLILRLLRDRVGVENQW